MKTDTLYVALNTVMVLGAISIVAFGFWYASSALEDYELRAEAAWAKLEQARAERLELETKLPESLCRYSLGLAEGTPEMTKCLERYGSSDNQKGLTFCRSSLGLLPDTPQMDTCLKREKILSRQIRNH